MSEALRREVENLLNREDKIYQEIEGLGYDLDAAITGMREYIDSRFEELYQVLEDEDGDEGDESDLVSLSEEDRRVLLSFGIDPDNLPEPLSLEDEVARLNDLVENGLSDFECQLDEVGSAVNDHEQQILDLQVGLKELKLAFEQSTKLLESLQRMVVDGVGKPKAPEEPNPYKITWPPNFAPTMPQWPHDSKRWDLTFNCVVCGKKPNYFGPCQSSACPNSLTFGNSITGGTES